VPVDSFADELRASVLEEVGEDLDAVARRLEEQIIAGEPHASGDMNAATHVDTWQLEGDSTFVTTAHIDVPYAQFVDEGTGVYGPTGSRIYPTSANALVFEWNGVTVAFASVAGQPGQHFFDEKIEPLYDEALNDFGR
jgi:hypothetical protein